MVGAVIGGSLGSLYANKVKEKMLKRVIGICFTAMGAIMIAVVIIK